MISWYPALALFGPPLSANVLDIIYANGGFGATHDEYFYGGLFDW